MFDDKPMEKALHLWMKYQSALALAERYGAEFEDARTKLTDEEMSELKRRIYLGEH